MNQQRKHARIEYETNIDIIWKNHIVHGKTINISQGGVLIATDSRPEFGSKVTIKIDLPNVKDRCEILSIVRWQGDNQLGLQFEILRPIEVWAINKLFK